MLEALAGSRVSTAFMAGVRGRAADLLEATFLPHLQALLPTARVLHADQTTGRAAGALAYMHVACTEYLTLMHVGGGKLGQRQGALVGVQGAAPPGPRVGRDLARGDIKPDPAGQQPRRGRPPVRAVGSDGDLRAGHVDRVGPGGLGDVVEDAPQRCDPPRPDGRLDLRK